MTLAAMLQTHDEAALSALASVGLVRRAVRDLAAGKAQIATRGADAARVTADGHDVEVTAAGPAAARCPCPAAGICRHVVLAILALRDDTSAPAPAETAPPTSARDDVLALTEAEIRAFAGADWDKAIQQATISLAATLADEGANLSVLLPETDKPVVLLAGLGLKDAVYKGPKTTKRRVVTAAALVVRAIGGAQALDALTSDAPLSGTLSTEFLQTVRQAIATAVGAVLGGGSAISEERLFDLSISARAQAAPRLTGLLRGLTRQARQARAHHFAYQDARFLSEAALATALTHALETKPQDPGLTGVLRRHYTARDDLGLVLLGAVLWQAASGARGTRIHAVDPQTGTWYATGQARGAGMDPSFVPRSVYNAPLWGLGPVDKQIGTSVHLEAPQISSDDQIAWDGAHATTTDPSQDMIATLSEAGLLFTEWPAARANLAQRMPGGLRRLGHSVPLLVQPSDIGDTTFDDIAQVYRMTLRDDQRSVLTLTVPATRAEDVNWLHRNQSHLAAILCEATVADLRLSLTPVTAYLRRGRGGGAELACCNLTFDDPKDRVDGGSGLGGWAKSLFKSSFQHSSDGTQIDSPIQALCTRALDAIAESLRFGGTNALAPMIAEAEALGLATLSSALVAFDSKRDAEAALRVSYVASEILMRAETAA